MFERDGSAQAPALSDERRREHENGEPIQEIGRYQVTRTHRGGVGGPVVLSPLEDSQVQARGLVIARIVSTTCGGGKNVSTELRAEFGTRRL